MPLVRRFSVPSRFSSTALVRAMSGGLAFLAIACGDGGSAGSGGALRAEAGAGDAGSPGDAATGVDAPAAYTSETYSDDAHWLCLPGAVGDLCHENLDSTVLFADGTQTIEPHVFAVDPKIDCFYVYPTISLDRAPNSDLIPGVAEINVVKEQAARLTSACDVYAPMYRQVTLAALFNSLPADAGVPDRELAYADVLDAWKHYLAHHNGGRGVVLVGHSQGAGVLRRLIQEEFDLAPAMRAQLVSALLIGGGVATPAGEDVGQDFQNVPVCRATTDTGCVVAYSSFRTSAPPPPTSLFGKPRAGGPGVTVCNHPAALAGGLAMLKPYFSSSANGLVSVPGLAPVTTPYVTLPDFLRAECVVKNGFSYLEVEVLGDPADPRPDDIGGDLTPDWGLHLADVHIAMGDLVDLVTAQAAAYGSR